MSPPIGYSHVQLGVTGRKLQCYFFSTCEKETDRALLRLETNNISKSCDGHWYNERRLHCNTVLDKEFPIIKIEIHLTNMYQTSLKEYDKTYDIPMSVLRLLGLRHMLNDSSFVRICWNIYHWFEFWHLFAAIFLEIVKMIETVRKGSFEAATEVFMMMPCVGYAILAVLKSYNLSTYRPIYENLIKELRSMWPEGTVTKEEYDIISKALKRINFISKGYYWCNHFSLTLFMIPPIIGVIKRALGYDASMELPFFLWFPFDPFRPILYEFLLCVQTWGGVLTIWFIVSNDLLFCVYISHITTLLDLLSVKISKFIYVPADGQLINEYPLGIYSKAFIQEEQHLNFEIFDWELRYESAIRDIISKHQDLIRLSGDVEFLFSFILLINFINSSIILCFCGFCSVVVEKWNHIIYKTFMVTALSQLWLLCWYGQKLLDSSTGICDALYNSGWYKSSQKMRSSILIMMHRSQKEVHVTTYDFSVISFASYSTILRTPWSYFTLLLNMYSRE